MFYRIFFVLVLVGEIAGAQVYPKGYFRNPLEIKMYLAGNFGECRPGHFHSGIDIKTDGRENLPVHAAADGYISRIKTEPGGFGHALYVTHPNGYTTLYAHLNDYAEPIQKYLRTKQYATENWMQDLTLDAAQFPVRKGDVIAYSGNTGASTAPHLHFEIRDGKTEHPLNPLLFGFPIVDHVAPTIKRLAIYDGSISIYEQDPTVYSMKKNTKRDYSAADTVITNHNPIGIALEMDDYMEGSDNTLAPYRITWTMDGVMQGTITLDDIGYDETRYVNAYADYKTHEDKGYWLQCLFRLPGNGLGRIYDQLNGQAGMLSLKAGVPHHIEVRVEDAMGNEAKGVIDIVSKSNPQTYIACCFGAGKKNEFEIADCHFTLGEKALYSDVCITHGESENKGALSREMRIAYPDVPLHQYYDLYIRPNKDVPLKLVPKMMMVRKGKKGEDGTAATVATDGFFKAKWRDFGSFYLAADTTGPSIKPIKKNGADMSKGKEMAFTISDEETSVKRYRGEIDGKYVVFERHGERYFYKFDGHCGKGRHRLVMRAWDENDNVSTYSLTFKR